MLAEKFQEISDPKQDELNLRHLVPRTIPGSLFSLLVLFLTGVSIYLSTRTSLLSWLSGQFILSLSFLQWFVLLHEAGHHTLFNGRRLNIFAGYLAGFFALIPFRTWRSIHARHHRWTGWQDKDATTATLVPRPLKHWERVILRLAWSTSFPLTAILYRWNNYWYLPRVLRYLPKSQHSAVRNNVLFSMLSYLIVFSFLGWANVFSCCWLGLLLSFAMQDILLLSQHTHIPQNLSAGKNVKPFSPSEQGQFTRSLRFPAWFSLLILHFDAHELHHRFVRVPGYDLRKIPLPAEHEVNWWTWLRAAKKIPGDIFFFQNSDETGFPW